MSYKTGDPALRATVAMANNGPNTNGSQFNLVFKDAEMAPTYTVFGTIDDAGRATIDKIAKGGIAGNQEQGLQASTVTVDWVRLG